MLIPVLDDFYGVARRLREIDPDLYLAWNPVVQRYEVHDRRAHPKHTLVLRVQEPDGSFRLPDGRVIEAILKYRGKSIKEIVREIDEHNEKLERSIQRQRLDIAEGLADDLSFAGKPVVQGVSFDDAGGDSRQGPAEAHGGN